MHYRIPASSWSKAPWGLSVLARVTSIFTGTSISPDALSRQRPNHYAFRAGRNLPDKEFRYLRAHIPHLSVLHRPVFLLNSCLGQFSAACFQAPLLPKLRGHFAEFLNNASSVGLRILSSSTCVGLRYGYSTLYSGFSWHMAHMLPYYVSVHFTSSDCHTVFPI